MGVEALDAGEGFDEGHGFGERAAVEFHQAGAALELVGGESGEGFSGAACGECVAGPGEEVADGDGRVATEEEGAGGEETRGEGAWIFHLQGGVFGGVGVGQADGFVERGDEDEERVLQRGFEDFSAREGAGLLLHFACGGGEDGGGVGEQNGGAVASVFGLGEEVGGDPCGAGRAVGDDENFAGSGQQIDGDAAEELAFGFDDVAVAGAEDFRDGRDGFGAEGDGGDGLGAADAVDFGGAGEMECGEEGRVDGAVRRGGGDGDNFLHAGGGGEGAGHERGGNEWRGAAGNIDADALERVEAFAGAGSLGASSGPIAAEALGGKGADVAVCGLQGAAGRRVESAPGGGEFCGRNAELGGGEFGSAEFFGQAQKGGITVFGDGRDDGADGFFDRWIGDGAAVERAEDAGVVFVTRTDESHGGDDGEGGGKSQGVEGAEARDE